MTLIALGRLGSRISGALIVWGLRIGWQGTRSFRGYSIWSVSGLAALYPVCIARSKNAVASVIGASWNAVLSGILDVAERARGAGAERWSPGDASGFRIVGVKARRSG